MNRVAILRYRYGSQRFQSSKRDGGYLINRLRDLKEQNDPNPDDPLVKLSQGKSLVDEDPELQQIYQKLPQNTFERKYRSQIQYARIPEHVDQQSKDTAVSKPWTGQEEVEDTSLRMLLDSMGKPHGSSPSPSANIGFVKAVRSDSGEPRVARASKKLRRRIEDAQDRVLKFQRDKTQELDQNEQSEFRTLYAEKFTPIGSFEKLRSLADKRIEESMKQGGFDGLEHIRGKPSSFVQLNQHIDRTEHHLNNMLVRQKITPPWIENQGRVNSDVSSFRRDAVRMFENQVISFLEKTGILHVNASWESAESRINLKFGSTKKLLETVFFDWRASNMSYFESQIKTINSSLRTYNLQAPLSTQKLYLIVDKELQRAYNTIDLKRLVTEKLQKKIKETADSAEDCSNGGTFSFSKLLKFW